MKPISNLVWAFSAIILSLIGLSSCTKTVTETVYVQVPVHDTTRGPALLRFISMLPSDQTVFIKMVQDPNAPAPFTARSASQPLYMPVTPDSAVVYYLYKNSSEFYGTVPMPTLPTNSLNTVALFKDSINSTFFISNDSMKLRHAPTGKCYIRFINGVANYPAIGPTLFLDLDSLGHSPFVDKPAVTGTPQAVPVQYGTMNDYTLIPSGAHQTIVRAGQEQLTVGRMPGLQAFDAGGYYTVRISGYYPDLTVAIDQD